MWRYRYEEDRIEAIRGQPSEVMGKLRAITKPRRLTPIVAITRGPRKPSVDSKLASIVGVRPEAAQARGLLFARDIPLRVLSSVLHRKSAIWGRF